MGIYQGNIPLSFYGISAYQQAKMGGYLGTETEFNNALANAIARNEVDNLLRLKAPLDSPNLTGVPIAPTAGAGSDTAQLATTAFVQNALTTVGGVNIKTSPSQPAGLKKDDFWYKII